MNHPFKYFLHVHTHVHVHVHQHTQCKASQNFGGSDYFSSIWTPPIDLNVCILYTLYIHEHNYTCIIIHVQVYKRNQAL